MICLKDENELYVHLSSSNIFGDKSLIDDLTRGRGIVMGGATFVSRPHEIKPLFRRFVSKLKYILILVW